MDHQYIIYLDYRARGYDHDSAHDLASRFAEQKSEWAREDEYNERNEHDRQPPSD